MSLRFSAPINEDKLEYSQLKSTNINFQSACMIFLMAMSAERNHVCNGGFTAFGVQDYMMAVVALVSSIARKTCKFVDDF